MKKHIRFDVMTLFPELVDSVLSESIIGRARQNKIVEIYCHNIRDYSEDKHRRVDDTPYGGGMGMLMAAPPIYRCYCDVKSKLSGRTLTVYMSPQGRVFNQSHAESLLEYDNIIILCGHYEGVDYRIIETVIDAEISVGDYVLTGGELPACIVIDALSRLVDGVLADSECYENESISCGALEYPQYTRPYDFMGKKVPDVLLSGNHKDIDKWRQEQSLLLTKKNRPDLI